MHQSMTGFASEAATTSQRSWVWEIKSVNGKGLDARFRLPEGFGEQEQIFRKRIKDLLGRGNLQISLKFSDPETSGDDTSWEIRELIKKIQLVEADAVERGLACRPVSALEILSFKGQTKSKPSATLDEYEHAEIIRSFETCLNKFVEMRIGEGGEITRLLSGQLDDIDALVRAATSCLGAREDRQKAHIETCLNAISDQKIDQDKLEAELALIVIKTDVSEEIDRLNAHIVAARKLLTGKGLIGRKFDFLTQEFNREANTLCAKSQHKDLTKIGLDMKVLVDQMREQVQNLE